MNVRTLAASSFLALSTATVGCTEDSPSDAVESANSASTSTRWQAVIRCDDGSVLDVKADEHRELQFVIRNHDAIGWMQHSIECNWSEATCPTNEHGEMIFRGHVEREVFERGDFDKVLAQLLMPASSEGGVMGLFDLEGDTVKLQIGEYYNWIFRGCR